MQPITAQWKIRHWFLDHAPEGSAIWVFKVAHFQSDGRFHSLQFPSGITLRLLVSGAGQVTVDGKEYRAEAGSYFCAIPGILLNFSDTLETPWEWWEWQITGSGALDYLNALGVNREIILRKANDPAAAVQTLHALQCYFDNPQRQPYHALSLLYEVGYYCAAPELLQPALSQRKRLVSEAQALLDSKLEEGININELAANLNADRTTLLRAFHQCLGISPLVYLQQQRLHRARELLCASSLPIREIARYTGFRTDKYFIRVFREANGTSPAAWRKNPVYPTKIAIK